MPVGRAAAASAIAAPRVAASATASSAVITPATASADSSPTLWPQTTSGAAPSSTASALSSAAAVSSGWATAVSRICSAVPVVPSASRSSPVRADQAERRSRAPGTSIHGDSMPGDWEP